MANKRILQKVLILTPINTIMDAYLEADTISAESKDTPEAWGLNSDQMFKDEQDRYVQVVGSNHCSAIQIYPDGYVPKQAVIKKVGDKTEEIEGTDVSLVSSQTEDTEMVFLDYKKGQDSRLLWIGIIGGLVTIVFLIVVLKAVL